MMKVEQEMMCVLLEHLRDQGLISENIRAKARENILGTLDWPEFFCYAGEDKKEGQNGST